MLRVGGALGCSVTKAGADGAGSLDGALHSGGETVFLSNWSSAAAELTRHQLPSVPVVLAELIWSGVSAWSLWWAVQILH